MPLYQFQVDITAVHRVTYQVGSATGIRATETARRGEVRPIKVSLADILTWEADLSTLREIETEAEAGQAEGKGVIPLHPTELQELLDIIERQQENGRSKT